MSTFGLVHGAWLGGWCWSHLVPHLEERGHAVVTVDLPGSSPSLGSLDYAKVVEGALAQIDEDLVLVGHSLGALTIPVVAVHRPVRRLVYLCGVLRDPGKTLAESYQDGTDADMSPKPLVGIERHTDGTTEWVDEKAASQLMWQDSEPADATLAFRQLQPQLSLWHERCPIDTWPDVASTYILCTEDRLIRPGWARRAAQAKLGVRARELSGGHSPFLSRPAELAHALCQE
jgi:pimeloyl-ACP methyl ester carboxylesterase